MQTKSLKSRITFLSLAFGFMLLAISSLLMYYVLSQAIDRRMKDSYLSTVTQIRISFENTFLNLASVSQLFTPYGDLGESILKLSDSKNAADQSILMYQIKNNMSVLVFSNPNIRLCAAFPFGFGDGIVSSTLLKNNFNANKPPVLLSLNQMTYSGPHVSNDKFSDRMVISSIREVDQGSDKPIYVYVEANFDNLQNLMEADSTAGVSHLVLDSNQKIVYSEGAKPFTRGLELKLGNLSNGKIDQYYFYQNVSTQGFSVVTLVGKNTIKLEKARLFSQYLLLIPLLIVLSIGFSLMLFRLVNKPLQSFYKGIEQMEKGDFITLLEKTNIHEFDILISQIHMAKLKIGSLLDDIREKDKIQSATQLSKLRAQINPHFLLNTLNTVHWLAIARHESDIDKIVLNLTKILSYNLRNDKDHTSIRQELETTRIYLELQQLKYDFNFAITNNCGEHALECTIPRFILQPLVENCILHCSRDNLFIGIILDYDSFGLILRVEDNGGGMSPEKLEFINQSQSMPEKLGIGLAFTVGAINSFYGRNKLVSFVNINDGLAVTILLPQEKEEDHDKNIDCGR